MYVLCKQEEDRERDKSPPFGIFSLFVPDKSVPNTLVSANQNCACGCAKCYYYSSKHLIEHLSLLQTQHCTIMLEPNQARLDQNKTGLGWFSSCFVRGVLTSLVPEITLNKISAHLPCSAVHLCENQYLMAQLFLAQQCKKNHTASPSYVEYQHTSCLLPYFSGLNKQSSGSEQKISQLSRLSNFPNFTTQTISTVLYVPVLTSVYHAPSPHAPFKKEDPDQVQLLEL